MIPSVDALSGASYTLILSTIVVQFLAMVAYAGERAVRSTRDCEPALQYAGAGDPSPARTAPARRPWGAVGDALGALGTILLAVAVLMRAVAAGRVPLGNMYEFAISGALATALAYIVIARSVPLRSIGVWISGTVVLLLGLAVTVLYAPTGDLVPALNSMWLAIHVTAATIAGGVFAVGAVLAGLLLVRTRRNRTRTDDGSGASLAALERIVHGVHVFAFPIWTFAVIAGAIWAENAWGRYWGWDPKETWAFITWVLYAAYLHAGATNSRWSRRAPWFALAGFAAFVFNFFGVNLWISGLHSYAGV